MNNPMLLVVGAFFGVTLLIYLVGRLLLSSDRNQPDAMLHPGAKPSIGLGRMTRAFAGIVPVSSSSYETLQKDMVKAGYYHRDAADEFLAVRNAALVAWIIFVGVALVAIPDLSESLTQLILIFSVAVLILIFAIPRVIISSQASARVSRIQHALPDALDMITMTTTAGLPLQKSIKRVSDEMVQAHEDLACELMIIDRQAETGSLTQAIQNFAKRLEIPEVNALSTLVTQAQRIGGSVAGAFREFADSIRRTRRQLAEERGNQNSIKLLIPVIFLLAPPIYILLLGPSALRLHDFMTTGAQEGGALDQNTSAAASPLPERYESP
ncbi:type II secretion system F family protein [Blastopirellula retiformator]|uniref:Bacterial type II secretion system protein F domain protein n=1 Tax=Blastopirellula retiformator TaxID=2527970 RepID=A0A5C5VLV6_9BACT|nr:type II secretion system F family protein [Blastopirellula retiformator]TWT39614.1 Bacterial type II secretion system protein F domain protein [Blastopirellula retiformator]